MNILKKEKFLFGFLIAVVFVFIANLFVFADDYIVIPSSINIQGRLTKDYGDPIANEKNITIRLKGKPAGTTEEKTISDTISTDDEGLYSVNIGDIKTIMPISGGTLEVDGTGISVSTPVVFVSVPYSIYSSTSNYSFAVVDDAITTSMIKDGVITIAKFSADATTSDVTQGSSAVLTSGGAYTNLVRRYSTTAATGGVNQGVYIDANGQVQTCNATTSDYSASGTTAVNGTAVSKAISGATTNLVSNVTIDGNKIININKNGTNTAIVKFNTGFSISGSTIINLLTASTNQLGGVKIDNVTIGINNGTISVKGISGNTINSSDLTDNSYVWTKVGNDQGWVKLGSTGKMVGADLAEMYASSENLQPGDVVSIDTTRNDAVVKTKIAEDTKVAGVVSTEPGLLLNKNQKGYKLALVGKVPTKVCNEGGNIKRGDLLVSASIAGYAKKAGTNPKPGTIIGKALANFTSKKGTILVLVNLQ